MRWTNRQQNSELVLRGSKLVLNYTNGSPCDSPSPKSKRQLTHGVQDLRSAKIIDDDDDKSHKKPSKDEIRRKNTIILLSCQKDPLGPKSPKATISFAGEMDCTYIFEAKSQAACAGIETTPQQLGPGGVFGVMYVTTRGAGMKVLTPCRMLIAILVYIVGGCVYQRTVQHQRGWRQLPNYSMWAGIWSFLAVSPNICPHIQHTLTSYLGHFYNPHLLLRPFSPGSKRLLPRLSRRKLKHKRTTRRRREQVD